MEQGQRFFIVDAGVLPEVFLKVSEAKRMLEAGEANTVNEATQKVGISRSAFYKYKDSIRPFQDMAQGRIINFQLLLKDEPGVLSVILNDFASHGANILTINQSIPGGGIAIVHIGAETSQLGASLEEFLQQLGLERGVVRCEVLAG
ncbi:MAG: ACT domain-containing protein [Oscillospiraceae bacterium]|nr:ACT domain-containing protein [Oscillospiraceae bacterium]MBP3520362.1 ACT domain-containing protein [Oscillospiraceae bacterium]